MVDRVYDGREKTNLGVVTFLNQVCETELEPFIESSYQALANYVNAYDQKMVMARENIADRGIWTAKKRYILNVWDSEGVRYEEPKLKMMGIEAGKSSTPAPCKAMNEDALKIMRNGTEEEVIDFIDQSRKEFKKLPPEDIAFPRSASNVEKYKLLKLPLLIIKARTAAKSKINPDAASNLKKYLKGFVMCWIIAIIYFYRDHLSIAKKA